MSNVGRFLKAFGERAGEVLAAHSIGATRWRALADGVAPKTRAIVISDNADGQKLGAVNRDAEVPYISRREVNDIVTLAKEHGYSFNADAAKAAIDEAAP